jgi:hypothetical protein
MTCAHAPSALPVISAELVIDRPALVVERELPAGRYQVTLDPARTTMTISGPITFKFRAMSRSSAQPEPKVRAALRRYGDREALLLLYEPPQKEWVATKSEAPL